MGRVIRRGAVLEGDVGDAVVVEGAQHFRFKRVVEADLVGHVVVEKLEDVKPVGAFRSCGHAQQEVRLEVLHNPPVGVSGRAVGFVDHDVVEAVLGQACEDIVLRQSLDCSEDVTAVLLLVIAS